MTTRLIEPELLETFPANHPAAIHGRRDLRIVNAIMGNHRWMLRTLRRHYQPGWRITELGAGDGALSLRLVRSGLCKPGNLHAFDLVGPPPNWPREAAWTQGDLFENELPASEVLLINLLLHHFTADQLRLLGSRIPPTTKLILAAEPARSPLHALLGRGLCMLGGFHDITRHDMQVSIRAGFRPAELTNCLALGPDWRSAAKTNLFGACQFTALRLS